ncbi:MAG: hypothetical protein KDB79_15940 [Acidobacteria bacterium]|nr:hypothetical protein [Acidobacteriota bacterium]
MKQKLFVVFAIVILGFVSVCAQEKNYEIEVSVSNAVVSKTADVIPVTVKIRNYAEEALRIESLGDVQFFFSKCEVGVLCDKIGDKYSAFARIPSKRIEENESFEFEVNIADLSWKDEMDESPSTGNLLDLEKIPSLNSNFYGGIRTLEGYRPIANASGSSGQKRPVYSYKFSNVISITLE